MYRQSRIAKKKHKSAFISGNPSEFPKKATPSWENVHAWYDSSLGNRGSYYHENVILPEVLDLLELSEGSRLLDCGCGQGILERKIPQHCSYVGFDIAQTLIKNAKARQKNQSSQFFVHNAHEKLPESLGTEFSHAAFILSLQNMSNGLLALKHTSEAIAPKGKLVIVLNHPAFRIPRQSGWGVDPKNKLQYRWVNRYMSPMKIPIRMNPSQGEDSPSTVSFHNPLSTYASWLKEAGFVIGDILEWTSDKKSLGKAAKMENRSRDEIPLFLTIVAVKQST